MAAVQHLHDLALDFKADDVLCAIARRHARHFHGHRKARVGGTLAVVHAVDVGHATGVNAFVDGKAVQRFTRLQ